LQDFAKVIKGYRVEKVISVGRIKRLKTAQRETVDQEVGDSNSPGGTSFSRT
jgi:hypothetical protein